jgi:mono/diheme cytochrome c family protein
MTRFRMSRLSHQLRVKLVMIGLVAVGTTPTALIGAARPPQATTPAPQRTPIGPTTGGVRRQAAATMPQRTPAPITRELVDQYCVSCHNDRLKTAGLSLEQVAVDRVGPNAEIWEKVAMKISSGLMPPLGRPRPDPGQASAFVAALYERLDEAALAAPDPGRPVTHRLNRTEYANAINDLFALEIDPRTVLPADDTDQHGFDNNGEVLSLSPTLLERYLSAARKISRLALGHPGPTTSIDTYSVSKLMTQEDRASEQLPFGTRGGTAITHTFPVDGEYALTIRLQKTLYSTVRGLAQPHDLEVRLDRRQIKQFTVGGAPITPPPLSFAATLSWSPEWEAYANHADADLKLRFATTAGAHIVGVAFSRKVWEPEDVQQPPRSGWAFETDETYDGNPGIESVTIEGPFLAAGASDTPSRRRIFVCRPGTGNDTAGGETACARRILTPLARRAYRRPLADEDVDTLMTFFEAGRRNGDFEAGIETALQRLLVSPDFLFRIEVEPERVAPGAPYRITDVELASRLSFFLWSSGPDEELLDLASRGVLRNPVILTRQVQRLLADSRSSALVKNFAAQWLQLRDLRGVVPDPDLFPEFDENLREAFRQETELFLDSQIRANAGITDLLTADYTFVNERLARHYQIPGIYGSRFRRVTLDGSSHRGGLLGQGSLLTVTSYPNRTSPVLRGKWLLENILGTPPPPPPPDVPALKEKGANGERQSVRERLQEHRKNAVCATCHSQMDPLGFALEHYDAVGQYRTLDEARTPIDASGALPGGASFEGLPGLQSVLLERRQQFVGTVSERLLSFALGRGVEYYDRATLRRIVRNAAAGGYRWSAIITGIIESTPFQMRRAES